MKNIFAKRLKETRKLNNDLQKDLAEELEIGITAICNYEKGLNYPDVENLIKIAEYYNVSIDYLLGLSNEKTIKTTNIKYYKCKF